MSETGWGIFEPAFETWWRARPHLDAQKTEAHEAWLAGRGQGMARAEEIARGMIGRGRSRPDATDVTDAIAAERKGSR